VSRPLIVAFDRHPAVAADVGRATQLRDGRRMSERSALLACDLDSQVFGALPLALAFQARGWRVTFAIETARTLPKPLLERLAGQFSVLERSINALPTDDEAFRHHAIGVFVTGSRLALFRHTLEIAAQAKRLPRPALFCGFNGLVFEKFEEGLAWRLGYDVIGLNGPRDQDAFVDFLHATDFERQPSVIVGLRRKTDAPPRPLKIPQPVVASEDDAEERADDASDVAAGEERDADGAPNAAGREDGATAETSDEAPPSDSDDPLLRNGQAHGEDEKEPSADVNDDDEPNGEERDPDSENGGAEALEASRQEDGDGGPEDGEDAATTVSATSAAPSSPKKLFVFAEQVVVPRTLKEREALVATLARLAKASPGWDIALKARVRPDEQTFHSQPNHISKLLAAVRSKPRNLFVTYKPLDELLERADLFATISSTALFDAFDYGVPSLVATDFGLRNADGAHVFFASGLLVRLCDLPSLDDAPIQPPDERWVRRMGYGEPYSPEALIDWLETFDPAQPMPPSFVSFDAAAGVAAGSPQRAAALCKAYARVKAALDELAAEEQRRAAEAEAQRLAAEAAEEERPAAAVDLVTTDDRALAEEPIGLDGRPVAASPAMVAVAAPATASRPLPNPNAELAMLGFAITAALAPKAAASPSGPRGKAAPAKRGARKYEGPVAAFSRKLGMYWIVKRTRLRLGLPIYAPRD
jgi:hypothetical protein